MTEPSTLELFHSDQLKHFERIKKRLVWMYPQSEDMAWLIHRLEVLHDWHEAERLLNISKVDAHAVAALLLGIIERRGEAYTAMRGEIGHLKWQINQLKEKRATDLREAKRIYKEAQRKPYRNLWEEFINGMKERHAGEHEAPLP
jgi:hypothetical protein